MKAILKKDGMAARQVEILGFVKTHITETVAVVALPDGRLIEASLYELTATRRTPEHKP